MFLRKITALRLQEVKLQREEEKKRKLGTH